MGFSDQQFSKFASLFVVLWIGLQLCARRLVHDAPTRLLRGQTSPLAEVPTVLSGIGFGLLICGPAFSSRVGTLGGALMVALALFLEARRLKPMQVIRGDFYDGVGVVRRRAGIGRALLVFLVPEGTRVGFRETNRETPIICMPKGLISQSSKSEINALVAMQLPFEESARSLRAIRFANFAGAGVIALGVPATGLPPLGKAAIVVLTFVVGTILLGVATRRYKSRRHTSALSVSDNAETYVRALARLWAYSHVPLNREFSSLAKEAGLTSGQLNDAVVLDGPIDEKYMTSGDYLAVGFE